MPETPAAEIRTQALDYVRRHNVMTLATGGGGAAWAAPVFYAAAGFDLFFLSDPEGSRHGQDIGDGARASASITEDYQLTGFDDWRQIRGLQIEGYVAPVSGETEMAAGVAAYAAKYSFTAPYLRAIAHFPKAVSILEKVIEKLPGASDFAATLDNKLYRLRPDAVWWVDNAANFEKRQPVPLAPRQA